MIYQHTKSYRDRMKNTRVMTKTRIFSKRLVTPLWCTVEKYDINIIFRLKYDIPLNEISFKSDEKQSSYGQKTGFLLMGHNSVVTDPIWMKFGKLVVHTKVSKLY